MIIENYLDQEEFKKCFSDVHWNSGILLNRTPDAGSKMRVWALVVHVLMPGFIHFEFR